MQEATDHRCELCCRRVAVLTKHHLIPRTRHGNRANKKRFDRRELRERIARLCKPCHKQIHSVLDEKTLERSYCTVAALASHPEIARFVAWIRERPDGTVVPSHETRDRRRGRRRRLRWS